MLGVFDMIGPIMNGPSYKALGMDTEDKRLKY